MKTYEQVDVELNEKFPSICSKLLDAILTKFNEDLKYFKVKLATMLETGPFVLRFRVYGLLVLNDDACHVSFYT